MATDPEQQTVAPASVVPPAPLDEVLVSERNVELKFVIRGLRPNLDEPTFLKWLRDVLTPAGSRGPLYARAKKPFQAKNASVSFPDADSKEKARQLLKTANFEGRALTVVDASVLNEEKLAKRGQPKRKRSKICESATSSSEPQKPCSVNDHVAEWWKIPYEEQVVMKTKEVAKTLVRTAEEVGRMRKEHVFIEPDKSGVVQSPLQSHYRNKVAFTVGVSSEGVRTVGFVQGRFEDGPATVVWGEECVLCTRKTEEVRARFEEYVRSTSRRDVHSKETHSGFWRQLEVRHFESTGECAVTVQADPRGISQEDLASEKEAVVALLSGLGATAVLWQDHSGVSNYCSTSPYVVFPKGATGSVRAVVLGKTFSVRPGSFFQTNEGATASLYSLVRRLCEESLAKAPEDSRTQAKLFDVCCGTGTIGQILGDLFPGGVVGVEMVADAVEDAKANAASGPNPERYRYVCGKAEDVLPPLAAEEADSTAPVIAVVDPPRCGLHPKVLKALRTCQAITHLVYVSCKPESLRQDAVGLAWPSNKAHPGSPFLPVRGTGVDMFPNTPHLEMVMLFTR